MAAEWFEVEAHEPLANGDGVTWMHKARGSRRAGQRRPSGRRGLARHANQPLRELEAAGLKPGVALSRNRDHAWELALARKSAERRIDISLRFVETVDGFALHIADETGAAGAASIAFAHDPAQNADRAEANLRENLAKLGNTIFSATEVEIGWSQPWFVPLPPPTRSGVMRWRRWRQTAQRASANGHDAQRQRHRCLTPASR